MALGILKAAAVQAGFECRVHYANLWFAQRFSLALDQRVQNVPTECLLGEWIFSRALFPDFRPDRPSFYARIPNRWAGLVEEVEGLCAQAADFVDECARRVLAARPRIVGCSSMFHQQCASLALLRRVKELDPQVITLLGGANCEGSMGRAVHARFEWLDYVVSGEADVVFPQLCEALLLGGPIALPGVIGRGMPAPAVERIVLERMDESPCPDYDDYFECLRSTGLDQRIQPGLLVETSRGCWWGQKHHCTFCGLNGTGMNFRSKTAGRVLDDFAQLADRYGIRKFEVVDNIIDMGHIKTVLPQLAEHGSYSLFYETKANLKHAQLELMARAGVRWLQPGIESLHDEVLKLMDKGTSGLINVQLLKWCREFGIRLSWNMLVDLPGEQEHWYEEVLEWLPLLSHLQPPSGANAVRFDRFSPYFYRPEQYGLNLVPLGAYAAIYPFGAEEIKELAYFFEDPSSADRRLNEALLNPTLRRLRQAIEAWQRTFFAALPPVLTMDDDGQTLSFLDSRPVRPRLRQSLDGLARRFYLACDGVTGLHSVAESLELPLAEAEGLAADLQQRKLLIRQGPKLLALAVRGCLPELPRPAQFPGGTVLRLVPA